MSRRSSAGDLVPRDISEILAREGKAQRGQRKQAGSLGQAFGWLKGSRKKKSVGNGLNGSGIGVTEHAKLGYHNLHDAGPKGQDAEQKKLTVHYTASLQHYQENNVFIEASRPQYLEDLHTEAQEGLKIQQLQEHRNGVNFPDDTSTASADPLQPEQTCSTDRSDHSPSGVSDSGNSVTAANTSSTAMSAAVSTRPVLTRQASTFKPLNPVKTIEKGKKRTRRTTIMGIPQQVQKELALQRNSTFQQLAPTQLPNGTGQSSESQSGLVIIPTIDGETPLSNQEGARVHLTDLEACREQQLLRHHLHAVYQDDYQGPGSPLHSTSNQRPKSLAVPGMTTSCSPTMFGYLQEPQGPVMSISPQATYLSKIIPNAVLPASIDVIQIDRSSRARGGSVNHGGSVRTVSKSSLASVGSSASSASSRRSEGDGSNAERSLDPATVPAKAPGSNWSPSHSSETITSNPCVTFSNLRVDNGSQQTADLAGAGSQPKQPAGHQDHVRSRSPSVMSGNSSKAPGSDSGSVSAGDVSSSGQESVRNSQAFTRSLSVMKTKVPPAPPRRTNSLHHNKIRTDSSGLAVVKDPGDSVSGEEKAAMDRGLAKDEASTVAVDTGKVSSSSSPLIPMQVTSGGTGAPELLPESSCSSPQKTQSEEGKFDRTMSPSSGYSSQSGTPTLSPKGICPASPDKQKKKPVKPERSGSRASSAASASSSLTSLSSSTSEPLSPEVLAANNSPGPAQQPSVSEIEKTPLVNSASPATTAVQELFNIPPPPKVKAPCPPPPETWAHNRRTFELLCGPGPRQTQPQKPLQSKDGVDKKTAAQTGASGEAQGLDENQTSLEGPTSPTPESKGSLSQDEPEKVLAAVTEGVPLEVDSMISPDTEQESLPVAEKTQPSMEVQTQEQPSQRPLDSGTESGQTKPKKEPPPVMKKPVSVSLREESVSGTSVDGQQHTTFDSVTIEVHSPAENDNASSTQADVKGSADRGGLETNGSEITLEAPPAPDTAMHTLSVDNPPVKKASPPPSPPPAYQPTPPPTRKTPPSSVSTPPPEELQGLQEEETHALESSWPPPPPPLEGDAVFDGVDEMDFPPPPPPLADNLPDVVANSCCVAEMDVPSRRSPVAPEEDSVTMEDAMHTGNSVDAEVSTDLAQTVVEDVAGDAVTQGSAVEAVDEQASCEPVTTDSLQSDDVSLPLPETPPPPTTAPLSSSPLAPPTSVPPPPPLRTEDQMPPEPHVNAPLPPPVSVALTHALPAENQTCINFRRQPSQANRESRSKELLSRHKTTHTPKEDANIPLVTTSLLQMVRLRSVMAEDPVNSPSEESGSTEGAPPSQDTCPVSTAGTQGTPQKPIRKSLSLKSTSPAAKASSVTLNAPSMRLQEAIRMKTAAMSSRDGLSSRIGLRPSIGSSGACESGFPYSRSAEGSDVHKSPASTASFIFSRSTKKVVVETAAASSPEAQASLKQSLAAELMLVSDQSKASHVCSDGAKSDKVPPPVAKKPLHGSASPSHKPPACQPKTQLGAEANGAVQTGTKPNELETTTTSVTPDTIETLF